MQIRLEFLKIQDIYSFIECAKKIESQELSGKRVKWFVSSDQKWIIDKIKNETMNIRDKVITGVGKIGHIHYDSNAYERAVLDVELLARCDRLILTGGSTFGFVAAFKTRRRPYFIDLGRQCDLFDFSAPSRRPTGEAVF